MADAKLGHISSWPPAFRAEQRQQMGPTDCSVHRSGHSWALRQATPSAPKHPAVWPPQGEWKHYQTPIPKNLKEWLNFFFKTKELSRHKSLYWKDSIGTMLSPTIHCGSSQTLSKHERHVRLFAKIENIDRLKSDLVKFAVMQFWTPVSSLSSIKGSSGCITVGWRWKVKVQSESSGDPAWWLQVGELKSHILFVPGCRWSDWRQNAADWQQH